MNREEWLVGMIEAVEAGLPLFPDALDEMVLRRMLEDLWMLLEESEQEEGSEEIRRIVEGDR